MLDYFLYPVQFKLKPIFLTFADLEINAFWAIFEVNKLDPTKFVITDISKTHMDPVAKIIRKRLKEYDIYKGVNVVFSPEMPIKLVTDASSESKLGSTSFVPPVAGLILASHVIRELCEKGL